MNYSTLPFTLVEAAEPYLLDVGALYAQAQTLIDHRKARGRQYPLALIVTVAVLAKLAGYTHVEDIADWAKLRCQELHVLFGTKRARMPHHTTWSRILGRAVDIPALEEMVSQLLTPPTLGEVPDRCSIAVALDGKTIRGTIPRGQSRGGVHLLRQRCRGLVLTDDAALSSIDRGTRPARDAGRGVGRVRRSGRALGRLSLHAGPACDAAHAYRWR